MKNFVLINAWGKIFTLSLFMLPLAAWPGAPATPPAVLGLYQSPLTTMSSPSLPSNLMFILDNSLSMGWNYLPDEANDNVDTGNGTYTYGFYSAHCNGVAYNPDITYALPVKANGTTYPNASFTSAWSDGFAASGSVDLTNKYYYKYTGSEADLSYAYSTSGVISNTFYNQCTSREGSTPGSGVFTKVILTSASSSAAKQNYANWYSYYRTRLLMMKSSAGLAFRNIGTNMRVGFTTISYTGATNGSTFLRISDFTSDGSTSCSSITTSNQKQCWYSRLYAATTSGYTPLRGALAKVGKIYAGKLGSDPVQYACQKNFALLSTDGYWNTNDETSTYGPYDLSGNNVGQQDGPPTLRPMYDGGNVTATSTTTWRVTRTDSSVTTTPYSTVLTTGIANPMTTTTEVLGRNSYTAVNPPIGSTIDNSSLARPGSGCAPCTVTVKTSSDHGFSTGDYVTVSGAGTSAYNGTFQIRKKDNNEYYYDLPSRPSTNSGAAGTSQKVTCAPGNTQLQTQPQRQTQVGTSAYAINWTTTATPSTTTATTPVTVVTPYTCTTVTTNGNVTSDTCPAGVPGAPTNTNGATTTVTSAGLPVVTTSTSTVAATGPTVTSAWANFGAPSYNGTCSSSTSVPSPNPSNSSTVSSSPVSSTPSVASVGPTTTLVNPPGITTVVTTGADGPRTNIATTSSSTDTGFKNTLADVAAYYYNTDLRTNALSNCTGSLGAGVNVCQEGTSPNESYVSQKMQTYTLGLGVKGVLNFSKTYLTDASGDYRDIVQGTKNWPDPDTTSNSSSVIERIDDLWHAAVNGGGRYFSAGDPTSLAESIATSLQEIDAQTGVGAAAATSNLEPVAGDNYAFVASYKTVKWNGNLEARAIDVQTGQISSSAIWCAQNVPANPLSGISGCTGTMNGKINTAVGDSDTRNIKFSKSVSGANVLTEFSYSALPSGQQAWFNPNQLSQYGGLSASQRTNATGDTLVRYLRGQWNNEGRVADPDHQVYRSRDTSDSDTAGRTLGDFIGSQPVYVKAPYFDYSDLGYADYKISKADRAATVFIGGNDGMLHAFDATNGNERWAFIPTAVMQNMYRLADDNYSNNHQFYVDGSPIIGDICVANCSSTANADWRTILVGGLNGGGKGYYALDITDPVNPQILWEITSTTDSDIGFSYGTPVITKKADGTWKVLLTSGYNNNGGTNTGKGVLFIVNPLNGAYSKLVTTAGDNTNPSGLSRITAWADEPNVNATATDIFGGDLQGNVWHFDINTSVVAQQVAKVAVLSDPSGNPQPITTNIELGKIGTHKVLFVATGKLLELRDVTDAPSQVQSVYAIKYPPSVQPLTNLRSGAGALVQQSIVQNGVSGTRSGAVSPLAVNFDSGNGWFVDFPDSGERNNVNMQLVASILLVPTNVPIASVCEPGGYSWMNFLDYKTGSAVKAGSLSGERLNAAIVGFVTIVIGGVPVVQVTRSDNPTPVKLADVPFGSATGGDGKPTGKRVSWRELLVE